MRQSANTTAQAGGHLPRLLRTTSAGAMAIALAFAPAAQAADHWLSGARTVGATGGGSLGAAAGALGAAAGVTVFDLTISLDTDPQGDDDSTVDDGANDAEQRAYEDRIKALADALYQMTNGRHKLGKVTIYRNSELMDLVDIQWFDDCGDVGPRASIGGFGKPGLHVRQCNTWDGFDMSAPAPSGYTMAHELGHYIYSLFDEYAQEQCDAAHIAAGTCWIGTPRGTDTQTVPSIMNSQWVAAFPTSDLMGHTGPRSDFLEFSTPNRAPYTDGHAGTNAHKRVYGESIWTTLTRSSATDPKYDWLSRTHYADLVAPAGPAYTIINNDLADARSELDIRWLGNQVAELMIDISGSMGGSPIVNARTAANLLIDTLPEGKSAIGVGSFNAGTRQNFPITAIPDPDTGVRAGAKAAVNALSASGLTAMYDGLMLALDQVNAYTAVPGQSGSGVVYLLSDGGDNASRFTPAQVTAAYRAAGVAIVALGYGSGAPTSVLSNLASETGGQYFQSPTTLPEIQATFLAANAAFSSTMLVVNAVQTVDAGATQTFDVPVDSSMSDLQLNLSHREAASSMTFRLLDPAGADTGLAPVCTGSTSCSFDLDSPAPGTYRVEMVSGAGIGIPVTVLATARPQGSEAYVVRAGFGRGQTTTYPAPLLLEARVNSGGIGLTGLDVTARITDADGNDSTVTLLDDGRNGDARADDGTYTVSLPYSRNGLHSAVVTASNAAGLAQTTDVGTDGIMFPGTGPGPVFVPRSVTENFSRAAAASSNVAGFMADDHADDPAGGACTVVADDNIDTAGRIDAAGDVDCFSFTPSATDTALSVRATRLAGGMDAVITVYDAAGTTEIASFDMSASANSDSGLVATIPAATLDAAGHIVTVAHADATASMGSYNFSVGTALTSDVAAVVAPVTPPAGGGGGGSFGPFGLLGLALLSLLGLRRRRSA